MKRDETTEQGRTMSRRGMGGRVARFRRGLELGLAIAALAIVTDGTALAGVDAGASDGSAAGGGSGGGGAASTGGGAGSGAVPGGGNGGFAGWPGGGSGGFGGWPTTCGNGVIDPGEDCDGSNLGGETCDRATMGAQPFGTLYCSPACSLEYIACQGQSTGGGGGMLGGGATGGAGATGATGGLTGFGGDPPFQAIAGQGGTMPSSPADPLCVPGEQRACACGLGRSGYQICADSGMALDACVCDGSAPDGGLGADSSDPAGCSCRVGGASGGTSGGPWLLLGIGLMLWRRPVRSIAMDR